MKSLRSLKLVCLLATIWIISMILSCTPSDRARQIQGRVTISREWLEIRPESPLRLERSVNLVEIFFAKEYSPDMKAYGLRMPDGSLVVPEVELLDQAGRTYPLQVDSIDRTSMGLRFTTPRPQEPMQADLVFQLVRIRTSQPIECAKIVWRSYEPQDHY